MAQYSKLIITNDGQALMAKMIAGEGDIEFTKIGISNTKYQENQLQALSSLSSVKQTALVSKVTRTNEVAIKVDAAFTNAELETGYYMYTLGLYALDPDEGEILYAACIETSGNCYMPAYNGITVSAAYFQLYTTVGNADSVSLEVNPGAYATVGDIQELENEIADLKAYIGYNDDDIYGVEVDFKNNKFTRLAGAVNMTPGEMFDDVECFGGRKRVNLTDDGVELSAYGEAGYTETGKLTTAVTKDGVTYPTGTPVQVMVKQPKFWYKVVPLETAPIKYPQMEEIAITGAATAAGSITLTIGSESKTATVESGNSASTIAGKIAALSFTNFQTRQNGTTVRFVSRIEGKRDKLSASYGSTGVTGTTKSYAEAPANGVHMRKARYYVSPQPKAGFKLHPAFTVDGVEQEAIYRAAFEPCIYDVSASAYLMTDEQVADFTSSTGDKLSSIAGAKPCSGVTQNLTRANARTLAANRGDGWCQDYTISHSATEMLMLIEYAGFNMQTAIGAGHTNRTDDGSTNMSELTGATSNLGNASGAVTVELGDDVEIVMVSYRGEENLWGNIWKHEDGINVLAQWTHAFYIADNTFADSKDDGSYKLVDFPMAFTEGYISAFGYTEEFDFLFIASEVRGNSSLPVGDYCYSNVGLSGWHIVISGASWDSGSSTGPFSRHSNYAPSYRIRNVSGGRLVYRKAKNKAA